MGYLKAQVRLARATAFPEDVVVNTFHFGVQGTNGTVLEAQAIETALETFYSTTPPPSASPLTSFMSNLIGTGGHRIKVYDMNTPEPRIPLWENDFTLGAHANAPLPAEVALTLSFAATPAAGISPARLRGRIFFGPLSSTGTILAGTDDAHPSTALQGCLANAGERLMNDATVDWCVYSTVDQTLNSVTRLWVDNAFDTQRRRGSDPSGRIVRP